MPWISILMLLLPLSLFAQKEKPCLDAINKFCKGVSSSMYEECLDQRRKELTPKCVELLDQRIAEKSKYKKAADAKKEAYDKSLESPMGQCRTGNVICPMVTDREGSKRRANSVPCPCHGDNCLSTNSRMCIEPSAEEKFAEDLKVSDGIITEKYNQCLHDAQVSKVDPKKCDNIHPFRYRGLQIPKQDSECVQQFSIPASIPSYDKTSYQMQVAKICSTEAPKSEKERSCILKQIPKGGFNQPIYNLYEASTQCDPLFQACKKTAAALAGSKANAEYLDQNCRLNPALSPQEIKCLAGRANLGKDFKELNGPGNYTCLDQYRPCAERLQKNIKGQPKASDYRVIASSCKEDSAEVQDCVYKYFGEHFFSKKSPSVAREAHDVSQFCNIKNAKAFECVKSNYQAGLNFTEASIICKYASESMRQCLSEYSQKKGPLASLKFDSDAIQLSFANEYCSYSESKDQSCFLTTYKEMKVSNPHERSLDIARSKCHNFTLACYENFHHALPQRLQFQLSGQNFSIKEVCEGGNELVQSCLFTKILGRYDEDQKRNQLSKQLFGETSYAVDTYKKDCLKEFTGYLISEMPTNPSLNWKCDEKIDFKKIPDYLVRKYCDLGLNPAECDQNKYGEAWSLSSKVLKEKCSELKKFQSLTTMEENILRRCRIEKL